MPTPVAAACGCSAAKVCIDTAVGAVCATLPAAPVIVPIAIVAAVLGMAFACLSGNEKRRT